LPQKKVPRNRPVNSKQGALLINKNGQMAGTFLSEVLNYFADAEMENKSAVLEDLDVETRNED
jgi:hypothetical protein